MSANRPMGRSAALLAGQAVVLALVCSLLTPSSAVWGEEPQILDAGQVSAARMPWSGYWWPQREGAIRGPLAKYDHLTGAKAVAWEDEHHPAGESVPEWYGYCHAWAASAVLERQPTGSRLARRSGREAELRVADQKGLLAASHAEDVANIFGDRFGDGEGNEDPSDLTPDALWRLLNLYLKQQEMPLILDVEAGAEVWNYPVFAYRVSLITREPNGTHHAQLALWMADDAVAPDFVGLKVKYQTHTFSYRTREGAVVAGSGRWTGANAGDHPDFAWSPYVVQPENPEIDYAVVQELLGDASASPSVRPEPAVVSVPPEVPPLAGNVEPPPPVGPAANPPPRPEAPPAVRAALLSPTELVSLITSRTSAFALDVTVDRFDGGHYRAGEDFKVTVSSAKAGYLYLFHISPEGTLQQLFPTGTADNRIAAGGKLTLPVANSPLVFRAALPAGAHRIKAVVTTRPLILSGLVSQAPRAGQAAGGQQSAATFRWHPTLSRFVSQWLRTYLKDSAPSAASMPDEEIRKLLGEFSQDEVAYHVAPAERP